MATIPKITHIAYRCPDCGTMVFGLIGQHALSTGLLRLKCSCDKSILDASLTNDKKVRLSVPCTFCNDNHNFVLSQAVFFEHDIFYLNCPYANMDIGFIGEKEKIDVAIEENTKALSKLIADIGAETLKDIQPMDMDEDEILPDASVYDLIRFVIKDLEAEGKIDCPCHSGCYDLRFAPGGIQAYCPDCGATYLFNCDSASAAEEYVNLTEVYLK